MSDTYDVNGVTITPSAGGWYELAHPSLPENVKVQGKEAAEAKAAEVAAAAVPPEGSMEQQPNLDAVLTQVTTDGKVEGSLDHRSPAEKAQETQAKEQGIMEPTPTDQLRAASADPAARDEDVAALRSLVNDQKALIERLLGALQPVVQTVTTLDAPEPGAVLQIPRVFAGQMDDDTKALLKKAGIGVVTIVLEDNDSIPPTGLFVGHNGRSYMIKPGEEVDVPSFITDLLDDAVMSTPMVDGSSQKILGYRDRSKYPYRVVNTKG